MSNPDGSFTLISQPPEFELFPNVWSWNFMKNTINIGNLTKNKNTIWYHDDKMVIGTTIISDNQVFVLSYLRDPKNNNWTTWDYDTFYKNRRGNGIIGLISQCSNDNHLIKTIEGTDYQFIFEEEDNIVYVKRVKN
jgi:hypothetical protein